MQNNLQQFQNFFSGNGQLFDGATPWDLFYAPGAKESLIKCFESALQQARENLEAIRKVETPTFENVCLKLETCADAFQQVNLLVGNLFHAHGTPDIQQLHLEFAPRASAFQNEIWLDSTLFAKIQSVHEKQIKILKGEDKKLLEDQYKTFLRNGALLNDSQKSRLKEIDQELAHGSPQFAQNVLKSTLSSSVPCESLAELEGLPENIQQEAISNAKKETATNSKSKSAALIGLSGPMVQAVLKFADNRNLRQKVWYAFNSRATQKDCDNFPLIQKLLNLRFERASLLGFKNHCDYVLSDRMAQNLDGVRALMKKLHQAAKSNAQKDFDEVSAFAKKQGLSEPLKPWDFFFYSEKLKNQKFSLDTRELKKFFPIDAVTQGMFLHAEKLFKLQFKERTDLPKFHPEMNVYEVHRNQNYLGLLYLDLFPRETKKDGAWMTAFRSQGLWQNEVRHPHISITCNFNRPLQEPNGQTKPSLLDMVEVTTLFHEFGHALHGLLSNCKYASLAGTNVLWDFVELPSQLMENWCYEPETLAFLSRHCETNQPLPLDWVKALKQSQNFLSGWQTLRQLQFAEVDLDLHEQNPSTIQDLARFEEEHSAKNRIFPWEKGTSMLSSFSHIFAGGYSSGYYSYKWAEALEADAFSMFQEKGVYNADIGQRLLDTILSKGGTSHPSKLFRQFRGRDPEPDALLRKSGLL